MSSDYGVFTADARSAILRDLNKNDQSDDQVRMVCTILNDALEEPLDSMHDFLQEMLPVDILFNKECFTNHRIFSVVLHVLQKMGGQVSTNPRMLISIKVARSLYTDIHDIKEAIERVEAWRRSKNVRLQPQEHDQPVVNTIASRSVPNSDSVGLSRNKATVIGSFKEEEKISGSVSGTVPLHRISNKFVDAIRDHSIPRTEEVNLMHCCLVGMALDYYYKSIREICQNVEEAFNVLGKQFNSLQHQAQARTYLNNLTMESIKREKNCTMLVVLETAHNRICDTVPNCGKEYQQPSHYCDFLQRMVERQPWAKPVIQTRLTPGPDREMDYNTFYSKLCAALTVEHSTESETNFDYTEPCTMAATFFGERYAVPRKPSLARKMSYPLSGMPSWSTGVPVRSMLRGSNRIKGRMSSNQLAELKARTRCLNCRKIGHWRHEC